MFGGRTKRYDGMENPLGKRPRNNGTPKNDCDGDYIPFHPYPARRKCNERLKSFVFDLAVT